MFKVFKRGRSFFFFLNRVVSIISIVIKETTLSILDSTGEPVSMESEIVRVVSLSKNPIFSVQIP